MKRFDDENVILYLVDDNELYLKILEQKFTDTTNYIVNTFSTGEKFLDYILANPPHKKSCPIAVLDYNLTTLNNLEAKDGIKILKTTKDIHSEIEIIMLSSEDDIDIATSAMKLGASTFIKKNDNSFLRLSNNIKWILSQKTLKLRKKHNRCAQIIFLSFLAITIILAFYLYN